MAKSWRIGVVAFWALGLQALAADLWTFDPPRMGRVLQGGDGAWVVDYTLGNFSAGAEFSFPLQLVYLNQRDNRGLFGPHWFCPQLESTVLPREHGVLVWTQPSGAEIALQADEKRVGEYSGADGTWPKLNLTRSVRSTLRRPPIQ